jgi:hypothetical protein
VQALISLSATQVHTRFKLSDAHETEQDAAWEFEQQERPDLAKEQRRVCKALGLAAVPDVTINWVGIPSYRSQYCSCCKAYSGGRGKLLFRPLGGGKVTTPRLAYTLEMGIAEVLCLDPILDDVEVDDIELEFSHPLWGVDEGGEHAGGATELEAMTREESETMAREAQETATWRTGPLPKGERTMSLQNDPALRTRALRPVQLTTGQTEGLFRRLAKQGKQGKLLLHIKAFAVELDYKGAVVGRIYLGGAEFDLGSGMLRAPQSKPASPAATAAVPQSEPTESRTDSADPVEWRDRIRAKVLAAKIMRGASGFRFEIPLRPPAGSSTPVALATVVCRGEASEWQTVYSRRLRQAIKPDDAEPAICGSCHALQERLSSQRQILDRRWRAARARARAQAVADEEGQGASKLALDYVVLSCGAPSARAGAARALADAGLLAV